MKWLLIPFYVSQALFYFPSILFNSSSPQTNIDRWYNIYKFREEKKARKAASNSLSKKSVRGRRKIFPSIKNNIQKDRNEKITAADIKKYINVFYEAAEAARVGKLFLDSIIFFSDFFASRSTPHPMIILFYIFFLIHPSIQRPHPTRFSLFLLRVLFYVFFSFLLSFFFSFHSNENHLNIIVIFFLFPTKSFFLLLQLLQPPTTLPTFLFYFHSLLYIAIATADTPTTKSYSFYTLHVLAHHSHYTQNGWIFSFFFIFPFSRWMIYCWCSCCCC